MATYTGHACRYTRIKNTSGQDMHFGYLRSYGTLAKDELTYIPGNVFAYLKAMHPGRKGLQAIEGFIHAVETGLISIEEFHTAECIGHYKSSSSGGMWYGRYRRRADQW